jgi:hypothetical protein
MRRGTPHEALTDFRLCKEFGWTLSELDQQPGKRLQEFLVILGEIDRKTQEEMDKIKQKSGR